ncbi:MAG: hypothetical protein M3Z03_08405, partial [Actinomycetota bacterium]|nr:hypothetical protein [Actinomycetota bacterium]
LSVFQAWATVHGKPYVGGSVSRYPDDAIDELTAIPLYREVLALQGSDGFRGEARFGVEELAGAGIGYVVYHRDIPIPAARDHLESLGLPVLADDGTVIVWRVPAN